MKSRLVLPHSTASAFSVTASLAIIYFVWASTYVGTAFVVEEIDPYTGSGFRFILAGLLLFLFILITKGPKALLVTKKQIRNAMFIGFILIGLSSPLLGVAAQQISSGLIALLVAMTPIFIAILRFIFGDIPSIKTILGIVIGFTGVIVVLVIPTVSNNLFIIICLISNVVWAIGSFWSQKIELPKSPLTTAAIQTLFGGMCAVLIGALRGERTSSFFSASESETWIAFIYISVMGAIAYSAYAFLLVNTPISLVATHAFVNPVVAIFLGNLLRNEKISLSIILSGAIVVVGIALVVLGEKKKELINPET
ncbi:MAG: EamA family transporter [Candidatus Nanopelagicales bacterium]|jgi:drug/metabolite transporter (DMT)-like permease|nr:EamA family transporter [Candidatus Nanopelagicales bacterium]